MRDHPEGPLHAHKYHELVVVLSGSGTHVRRTRRDGVCRDPIEAGDVFVVFPGTAHCYRRNHRLELVNLIYPPLDQWLPTEPLETVPGYHSLFALEPKFRAERALDRKFRLKQKEIPAIRGQLERIREELTSGEPGSEFLAHSSFMRLVTELSRIDFQDEVGLPARRPTAPAARMLAFIRRHLDQELSLERLSKEFGRSPSTLLREFRTATGTTPVQYILEARLRKAASLLRQTDLGIAEIADRIGFDDPNYFSRRFKQFFGVSAREWRNEARLTRPA